MNAGFRELFRRWTPSALRSRLPPRVKARARAVLGLEPWPDLAVRSALFRTRQYRDLRAAARGFDATRSHKPVLERGHQTAYVVARWFAAAGVKSAFQVGYASGRYLFYLTRFGIRAGGTDLPPDQTEWAEAAPALLDPAVRERLLTTDFFELTASLIRSRWGPEPIDVLFSEATFETMLPWRATGVSVPRYAAMEPAALRRLMEEDLPDKLAELRSCFRNYVFIEPEPDAGGAGRVFRECGRRLPGLIPGVWRFRPPLDRLFRLSPRLPTGQAVYGFVQDPLLTQVLGEYAERMDSVR